MLKQKKIGWFRIFFFIEMIFLPKKLDNGIMRWVYD